MMTCDVDETELLSDRTVTITNGPAVAMKQIWERASACPHARVALAQGGHFPRRLSEVSRFRYGCRHVDA